MVPFAMVAVCLLKTFLIHHKSQIYTKFIKFHVFQHNKSTDFLKVKITDTLLSVLNGPHTYILTCLISPRNIYKKILNISKKNTKKMAI